MEEALPLLSIAIWPPQCVLSTRVQTLHFAEEIR